MRASTGYGPQDTAGEVLLTVPSDVEDVARASCACLLGTPMAEQLEAFREAQREEDRIRDIVKLREEQGAYAYTFIDGRDQIQKLADESGSASLLAAAVAARQQEREGGRDGERDGERDGKPDGHGASDGRRRLGQDWRRMPLYLRPPKGVLLENEALVSALAEGEARPSQRPWRSFTQMEISDFGLDGTLTEASFVTTGKFLYAVVAPDVISEQSPSAHGAPLEGALFGFRPFLYPWPPAIALFGSFAGAVVLSSLGR
uniref:Uncharacterized protein n=1 Tax=Haptolina brevifila TaxID=156173 RepID=A0A7S2GSP4_9EUKA|mmetsp:Transcript_47304/g.94312  ORF Transcript_47304/g.94312 Transcript_47304/m.94312 type:complete len:259 (+) Transcript_47304:955-1731(+)